MAKEFYLDNSATTPISPAALERYTELSLSTYGNPSSLHGKGKEAEDVVKSARRTLSGILGEGCTVFTGSGTESNNLAIFGRAYAKERYRGGKILTTDGEHSSVNAPLEKLRGEGYKIAYIPTKGGVVDLDALRKEADSSVILATFMLVNNETGALYDIAAASRILRANSPGAVLHCDTTQAFGKVPFTAKALGADMITVSSHKIRGPKGVGALWISNALVKEKGVSPQILGGGQEFGFRSGTVNVPGIGAFAVAMAECKQSLANNHARFMEIREYALAQLAEKCPEIRPNLPPVAAPHILNITLPSVKSETMLHHLSGRGIYVSGGSACASHGKGVSLALLAFGLSEKEADCSLRISFGAQTEKEDIDALATALLEGLSHLARMR